MPFYNSSGVGTSVETSEITDGAVTTAKIGDSSITLAKIDGGLLALILG